MWSDDGRDVGKSGDSGRFLKHRLALSQRLRPGMRAKGPLPLKDPHSPSAGGKENKNLHV